MAIAGPGAGKTTGLVDKVKRQLRTLESTKYIAVITYTNAAAEKIRMRLAKETSVPPNLFIGTTHSFLNKFILVPYGKVFGIIPESDLIFVELSDTVEPVQRNSVIKRLREKGVIAHEETTRLSKKLVCGGDVGRASISVREAASLAKLIAGQFQSIFVDEYQDASLEQHEIFEALINANAIDYFYCVGDAEQYIYAFGMRSSRNRPNANEIPIFKMRDRADEVETVTINWRSCSSIVAFTNRFSALQQTADEKNTSRGAVLFVDNQEIEIIVPEFERHCERLNLSSGLKYYLSFSNEGIPWRDFTHLNPPRAEALQPNQIVAEAIHFICNRLNLKQYELRQLLNLSELDIIGLGLDLIQGLRTGQYDRAGIDSFITERTGQPLSDDSRSNSELHRIMNFCTRTDISATNTYMTIHKSKGLEADAALVVAETKNQLMKWLETDRGIRAADVRDTCRVGFVGFSRAKTLLCIGCLQQCPEAITKLRQMGVEVVGSSPQIQTQMDL